MKKTIMILGFALVGSSAMADVACNSLCVVTGDGRTRLSSVQGAGQTLDEALQNLQGRCDAVARATPPNSRDESMQHYLSTNPGSFSTFQGKYTSPQFSIAEACMDQANLR